MQRDKAILRRIKIIPFYTANSYIETSENENINIIELCGNFNLCNFNVCNFDGETPIKYIYQGISFNIIIDNKNDLYFRGYNKFGFLIDNSVKNVEKFTKIYFDGKISKFSSNCENCYIIDLNGFIYRKLKNQKCFYQISQKKYIDFYCYTDFLIAVDTDYNLWKSYHSDNIFNQITNSNNMVDVFGVDNMIFSLDFEGNIYKITLENDVYFYKYKLIGLVKQENENLLLDSEFQIWTLTKNQGFKKICNLYDMFNHNFEHIQQITTDSGINWVFIQFIDGKKLKLNLYNNHISENSLQISKSTNILYSRKQCINSSNND